MFVAAAVVSVTQLWRGDCILRIYIDNDNFVSPTSFKVSKYFEFKKETEKHKLKYNENIH